MPSSILRDLSYPVALVCHDAGAANHMFAWMEREASIDPDIIQRLRLLVRGPAEKLWRESELSEVHRCENIDELLGDAEVLVAGTGWASDLEYESIEAARLRGIRTISVIDHWTNYRQRFQRNDIEILPDEIWTVDSFAVRLAESLFHNIKIVQKENTYLENIVNTVRSHKRTMSSTNNVLYVLEPIREAWGDGERAGEFSALDFFIENINWLGMSGNSSILLRPHPSDPPDKYDQWVQQHPNHNISIDNDAALTESIAWADTVVGCQTYAMVIALAAGKKVFSSIPPWAPSCVLPHEGIINISELVKHTPMNDAAN